MTAVDPITTWSSFLASPAAPKTAMSTLELDGYLTGVIVTPQAVPVRPSAWIGRLWGDDDPIFADEAQINAALGAVALRYNTLIRDIDRSLERLEAERIVDHRPLFVAGDQKPSHDAVRAWARGFWRAMALAPATWSKLVEDERTKIIVKPFVGFFDIGGVDPNEIPDDVNDLLDAEAALIPRMILILRKRSPASAKLPAVRRRSLAGGKSGATIHAPAAQEKNTNAAALAPDRQVRSKGRLRFTGDRIGQSNTRGVGWEYVHLAIDDQSRLAYSEILPDEKRNSCLRFLFNAMRYFRSLGVKVERVMTDNGSSFRSRRYAKALRRLRVKHLRTKPYTPKTNGKAERFVQKLARVGLCASLRRIRPTRRRTARLASPLQLAPPPWQSRSKTPNQQDRPNQGHRLEPPRLENLRRGSKYPEISCDRFSIRNRRRPNC